MLSFFEWMAGLDFLGISSIPNCLLYRVSKRRGVLKFVDFSNDDFGVESGFS